MAVPPGVPEPRDDDEEQLEPFERERRNPSVQECIRLWYYGLEWRGDDTLYGTREFAAGLCIPMSHEAEELAQVQARRATWLASIQRLRASGLFDRDLAWHLMYHIVDESILGGPYLDDPVLVILTKAMLECCRRYGVPEELDWPRDDPNPPRAWKDLERAWETREVEMRCEVLRAAGEDELADVMDAEPEEFARRMVAVEERLERDFKRSRTFRDGESVS